jgi:hypothetical protein
MELHNAGKIDATPIATSSIERYFAVAMVVY